MNDKIDNTDEKILNILLEDADMSSRQIAKKCNIALGTVHNRIQKMKSSGIIKKKTILIDYDKLGYMIEVLIALKVKKGQFAYLKKLANHPNVYFVMDMTGRYDAELLARFHTRRQLDTFVKELQMNESVLASRTRLILEICRNKEVSV